MPRHRNLSVHMGLLCLTVALWLGPTLTRTPACPMCSENLTPETAPTTEQAGSAGTPAATGGSLAAGFYYSILFMLAVPFVMMTTFCGVLYVRIHKPAKPLGHARPS